MARSSDRAKCNEAKEAAARDGGECVPSSNFTRRGKQSPIAILGAGMMGCAIAAAHLRHGLQVVLYDNTPEMLQTAPKRIAEELRLQHCPFDESRLNCTALLSDVLASSIWIETITEKRRLKQKLYQLLFQAARESRDEEMGPLLFTNTSTIAIAQLAENMPEHWRRRFCGFHFFHPVRENSLLEIIPGPDSDPKTVEGARNHALAIGKKPIVVGDGPGFLVNRLLNPYLAVAQKLLHEGVPMCQIEQAATNFGMRMGPFRIMDEIGLDVVLHAGWSLHKAFPERVPDAPLLVKLVEMRRLGRKTGRGFMRYSNSTSWDGEGIPDPDLPLAVEPVDMPDEDIARRLFVAMYEEALRCRADGVISDLADADLASVEALGFPREKGGIAQWGSAELHGEVRGTSSSSFT